MRLNTYFTCLDFDWMIYFDFLSFAVNLSGAGNEITVKHQFHIRSVFFVVVVVVLRKILILQGKEVFLCHI